MAVWWDRHRVLKSDLVVCVNGLDKCYARCLHGCNFGTHVQNLNLRTSYFRHQTRCGAVELFILLSLKRLYPADCGFHRSGYSLSAPPSLVDIRTCWIAYMKVRQSNVRLYICRGFPHAFAHLCVPFLSSLFSNICTSLCMPSEIMPLPCY